MWTDINRLRREMDMFISVGNVSGQTCLLLCGRAYISNNTDKDSSEPTCKVLKQRITLSSAQQLLMINIIWTYFLIFSTIVTIVV